MIGTGKVDLTPFIIVSKTTWRFLTSMNLSYTFIGKPKGVNTNNLFNYAMGTIFTLSPHSILFGEIYGNTSSFGEAEIPESDITTGNNINIQELSGGEMVRSMGYGYYVKKELLLSLGISYDNNNAILIRPGIEWKFNSINKLKTN